MNIEIGQVYRVVMDDCCVTGEFTSKLLKAYSYDENDESYAVDSIEYGTHLSFENGVSLEALGGVQLEKVTD